MRAVGPFAMASVLLVGCVVEGVDFANKRCPCDDGWMCDDARNVCVEGEPDADGGRDAGRDAGTAAVDSGAPTDAGTVALDAGTDAGADAGPDVEPCAVGEPGMLFCDGFEDPALSAWPVRFGSDPVGRVTDRVRSGEGALGASAGPGDILGVEVRGLPDPGDDLYVRVWFNVLATVGNFQFLFMGEAGPPNDGFGFGLNGVRPYVYLNTTSSAFYADTVTVTEGRWTCIVAHLGISDTDGVVELYLDDELDHRTTGVDTAAASPYVQLGAGITWSFAGESGADVWLDDVAVSRSPLSCD